MEQYKEITLIAYTAGSVITEKEKYSDKKWKCLSDILNQNYAYIGFGDRLISASTIVDIYRK